MRGVLVEKKRHPFAVLVKLGISTTSLVGAPHFMEQSVAAQVKDCEGSRFIKSIFFVIQINIQARGGQKNRHFIFNFRYSKSTLDVSITSSPNISSRAKAQLLRMSQIF
jgi:hypothetical protein